MSKKSYPLIDIMRIISSILVVGIHTYPFQSIRPSLDFFFTSVLGRLAVPFFFMTTAFFLYRNTNPTFKKIVSVIKQFLLIYALSILLYFPVQVYNNSLPQSFPLLIQDLFINGTFYHLWYLPAVIIGLSIVCILKYYFSNKIVLIIVTVLYFIGMGGDAYYGLIKDIPILYNFYESLFMVCEYTRNGFFFAPLFIYLGTFIAKNNFKVNRNKSLYLFLIGFLIMFIEATLLQRNSIPKHDTMYMTLPFVLITMFYFLISFQGKRLNLYKDLSLYVYILHPFLIICLRFVAKACHIENLLIENNLIQFISTTVLSFIVALIILYFKKVGTYVYELYRLKH